jgi:hypothetical protein
MTSIVFTIVSILAIAQTGLACPDEKNCLGCSEISRFGGNMCDICEGSYLDLETLKCNSEIPSPVDHCSSYYQVIDDSKEIICQSCYFGFALNSNNRCVRCQVENCGICQTQETCSDCLNGFILHKTNECIPNKKCFDRNCDMCGGEERGLCTICKSGFALTRGGVKCVPDKGMENCWLVSEEGLCYECRFGYYITSKNRCLPSDSKDVQSSSRSSAKNEKHIVQTDLKVISL